MKKVYVSVGIALATFAFFATPCGAPAAVPARELSPLQHVEKITVPAIVGRIDHFTADAKRSRLIFSALGNNTVEIVDYHAGISIGSIKGLNQPEGALYVPEFDKLFVGNYGDGTVKIYDGNKYTFLGSVEFSSDADNLRWDEVSKRVFVAYGEGANGGIGMIDPATDKHIGNDFKTVGGHPEGFQIEKKGSRIFVNVPGDGGVIQVLDRKGGTLTKWALNGARGNFAMVLNEDDHRLFTITRKPPLLIAIDTETGKEVARVPVAGECDDAHFDSRRKRIYVVGAEGFISVVQENDPDHYELIQNVPLAVGARTGYFHERLDRFYLGVPAKGIEPAQVWTYEAQD